MDTCFNERNEMGSLGIVFFCNKFIRALDEFSTKQRRPEVLEDLCDKAISSLHGLNTVDMGSEASSTGLMSSADELATLAASLERHFGVRSPSEAAHAVDRILKAVVRIKTQKEFTEDLRQQIGGVIEFLANLADEGLASCRRQASGEATEAERVWQHYAMTC